MRSRVSGRRTSSGVRVRPSTKRSTSAPGSWCTTSGERPAAWAARLAAASLKRRTPWTGMSSPMRTKKLLPRSSTRKFAFVMPPPTGRGSTAPDQQPSRAARSRASPRMARPLPRRTLRAIGAQLLEAGERAVGVRHVEDLEALEAVAFDQRHDDEDVLERAAVAQRPERAANLHLTVAVPGEDAERLRPHVGRQLHPNAHPLHPPLPPDP